MNLLNLKEWCRKNFPDTYRFLSRRMEQYKDMEEKARVYIAFCTFVCFSIGMIYDSAVYALSKVYPLLAANLISLFVYFFAVRFYLCGKLAIFITLVCLLFVVQTNVFISIFYNYTIFEESNRFLVSHDLFIGFIVCILASLSLRKKQVYLLCLMPLISLAAAFAVESPAALIHIFPSFTLAYLSPPVLLTYIRIFLWDIFRQNEQLLSEKKSLCQLMGMNEKQWDLLINVVQKTHAPRRETQELFSQMQEVIADQLVIRAERLLADEELMGQIDKKYNFSLTANEVRLCCLILEDKSIGDISKILYVNESTIRANRSRIRKKMKLDKDTNLKTYLRMLVAGENSLAPDNSRKQKED